MHLRSLTEAIEQEISLRRLPGVVLLVSKGGQTETMCLGFSDPQTRLPMTHDVKFWAASMTKPMMAVTALVLVARGLLQLDDPIEAHLPQFEGRRVGIGGERANRSVTILDLMAHTSGIIEGTLGRSPVHRLYTRALKNGITPMEGPTYIARLADLPLLHHPGVMWHYGFGFDVLGQIVEHICAAPLSTVMNDVLLKPLEMSMTSFAGSATTNFDLAQALIPDPMTGKFRPLPDLSQIRFDSGGSGIITTARDYMRFAQMLLHDGLHKGTRILESKLVRAMTSNRLAADVIGGPVDVSPLLADYGFGLGVAVAPNGDYTWPSFSGTNWWNSPASGTSVVWMAHTPNQLRYHFRQLLRHHLANLPDA